MAGEVRVDGRSWRLSIGAIVAVAETRELADGGTVGLSEVQGPYLIKALTSPNPFRSGPVEINVFVQDATTGDALPDANVRLSLAPRDEPDEARTYTAHSGATTNKLFHSATFELPTAGEWTVAIEIEGPAGAAAGRRSTSRRATGCRMGQLLALVQLAIRDRRPVRGPPDAGPFDTAGGPPRFDDEFLATRRRGR